MTTVMSWAPATVHRFVATLKTWMWQLTSVIWPACLRQCMVIYSQVNLTSYQLLHTLSNKIQAPRAEETEFDRWRWRSQNTVQDLLVSFGRKTLLNFSPRPKQLWKYLVRTEHTIWSCSCYRWRKFEAWIYLRGSEWFVYDIFERLTDDSKFSNLGDDKLKFVEGRTTA